MNQIEVTDERRGELMSEVAGFLVTAGFSMRAVAEKRSDVPAQAVAACVQMCGALARGVHDLIERGNFYAAASAGRQILETTPLISYLTANPSRAEFWLSASDEDMLNAKDFRPASVRQATTTSGVPYSHHCAIAGHPRSIGRLLLPGGAWYSNKAAVDLGEKSAGLRVSLRGLLFADSLQHLYETVLVTLEAADDQMFAAMGPLEPRSNELTDQMVAKLAQWRKDDPLARLQVG